MGGARMRQTKQCSKAQENLTDKKTAATHKDWVNQLHGRMKTFPQDLNKTQRLKIFSMSMMQSKITQCIKSQKKISIIFMDK
jgi:general stress protein 26